MLSMTHLSICRKVFLTLSAKSFMFSLVIWRSNASLFTFLFTRWKRFSMGFKSGLLGGIANKFAPTAFIAALAFEQFWLGSPSCTNSLEGFLLLRNIASNSAPTNSLKNSPFNCSYCLQHITPWPYEMATKSFTRRPPVPTWDPLAVQLGSRPSQDFLHTRPLGALACSHGLNLCTKLTPSK